MGIKQGELLDVTEKKIVPKKKAVKKTTTKAVTVPKKQPPVVQSESAQLLKMAIDKDLDVDKLEKLIDLKVKEEARQCKKDFDFHFNEMQIDYIPVIKGREVTNDSGTHMYNFAPLEDILKIYAPIIAKHGFSYSWEEETIKDNEKRIWCIVSGYGHEKKGYYDIPINPGNKFANAIQQRGISTSYGKRISFVNIFGVIIKEQDDDASSLITEDNELYVKYRELLEESKTLEVLSSNWSVVWKSLGDDTTGKRVLMGTYNTMKGLLSDS